MRLIELMKKNAMTNEECAELVRRSGNLYCEEYFSLCRQYGWDMPMDLATKYYGGPDYIDALDDEDEELGYVD